MSKLRIFTRTGEEIAELIATAQYTWLLNEAGTCTFSLTIPVLQENPEIIQYGNLVYIEHEKLPAWGGVIDTPRTWSKNGVTVTAYSGEYLLKYRYRLKEEKTKAVAGVIFKDIVDAAALVEDMRLRAGEIYRGGLAREETLGPGKFYDDVIKISENSGQDWMVIPKLKDGKMHFTANWYKSLGEVTPLELEEGNNLELENNPLREQGEILNEITGLGDGANFELKPKVVLEDRNSQAAYGIRQGCIQFDEKELTGTLKENTHTELVKSRNPRVTLRLTALDVGDTFDHLRMGNLAMVNLHSVGLRKNVVGYYAQMRIVGMTVIGKKAVSLVCDEVFDAA